MNSPTMVPRSVARIYASYNLGVRVSQVKPSNCFRLTPYVSDFQTFNNPGSSQSVGALQISFIFHFWHKSVILDDVKLAVLFKQLHFEWKNVAFSGGWVKTYSDPSYIFSGGQDPVTLIRICAPARGGSHSNSSATSTVCS